MIFSITEAPEDPEALRRRALFLRNVEWFSSHWMLFSSEPYRGRYVAVSEGEIFVADDASEAERLAFERHPHDVPYIKLIPKERHLRIYACRGPLVRF